MKAAISRALRDDDARRVAITSHNRSLLVEAGAGSGKTAVMAGRIAAMLAEGVSPKLIAAVTFTELAASELLGRVREFVDVLAGGSVPPELKIAYPDGLSQSQNQNLASALAGIDEITCSTIHGFCQRLIKPYPVEADIDPGASVMDRNQADLAFIEIAENWLREHLAGDDGDIIAEMVLQDPGATIDLIHKIVANMRGKRETLPPPVTPLLPRLKVFRDAARSFGDFMGAAPALEQETKLLAESFMAMSQSLEPDLTAETPAGLVRLLVSTPHPSLCTQSGTFRSFQKKGKWQAAARQAGLAKADGDRLNLLAGAHHAACCEAWTTLLATVAGHVLSELIERVRPVIARFRDHKRSAALLDFDDLIFSARDLLRDHEDVRHSLGLRYQRVLVDEFQDTDSLQAEIFWRLCGEPKTAEDTKDWKAFHIRAGALFLVGDPKQAIYRFRGADIGAYVQARDAFMRQDAESVLSISTNFRSCAPILTYVNERFKAPLSSDGQPGFTELDPFHTFRDEAVCVAALDIEAADDDGKANAERQRDAEAEAVAGLCGRLIGSEMILDRRSGASRACRPGDIALLAPTGSDLWRYEEALERYGIPVATQAGKGLFKRQEIQDLIALTRVLADRRDTLALSSLLRGPLVGLTEEELLDIVWELPRSEEHPEALPRLDLSVDTGAVSHPLARSVIEKLQALYRRTNSTTPHELLSQAVDVLRVRPILLERHRGQAERVLANVDLYLSLAAAFAVRGLRAFSETMTAAWTEEARAVEGRPDAQEEAVALYTMHAAKGLEWPIVVPVNTMTGVMGPENALTDRETNTFYCAVLGVKPSGYEEAAAAEKAELERERVRLWYVAATRARELLVLPRLDVDPSKSAWISLLDLSLVALPALELAHLPAGAVLSAADESNQQTREQFVAEAAVIVDRHRTLSWSAPSRDESTKGLPITPEAVEIWASRDDRQPDDEPSRPSIQGGRERGLILHKLFEEVLTGETAESTVALTDRARLLIEDLGQIAVDDPSHGLSAIELAGCVARTLGMDEIREIRTALIPELHVYTSARNGTIEEVRFGVADAVVFRPDGQPQVVIDWKSDVQPNLETLTHYRDQVRTYLEMTEADRGLIVFVTHGQVVSVKSSKAILVTV